MKLNTSREVNIKTQKMSLYEILVPTIINDKPVRTKHHKNFDAKVRRISGGLTILKPAVGNWISPNGELFLERMIPVRIACNEKQINTIADIAAKHYNQIAVMYYKITDNVVIKHYK